MRRVDRIYFVVLLGCFLYQASEALASRIPVNGLPRVVPSNRLPRVVSPTGLLATVEPSDFSSTTSSLLLPSKTVATRRSPLFSSASDATAAAGSPAGVFSSVAAASHLKRGLLGIRGGSTGFAVTKFAKSILDNVAASKTKCWAVLVVSILLETTASTLSKKARDTSNPGLFLFSISLNLISLCGFCTALAKLDVGVAYAIWAALGTVIVTTAGVLFFQEAMDPLKIISIVFVILGVVGLNLSDGH